MIINIIKYGMKLLTRCNVSDEIIDEFPNFNRCIVEVWKFINNLTPHFTGYVISYSCWD